MAKVIRSGVMSQRSTANHSPQRPKPAITSSAMQQDAVLVAELADAGEVAVGRDEDAVGADHGLEQDGRDRCRALEP